MEEDNLLPPPINFNCWKHHAGFIKEQIKILSIKRDVILLKKHLLKIGESQMDLYLGKLNPADISKQIIAHLKKAKILEPDKYINWLKEERGDYKLVQLSDSSIWTLRLGEDRERYVHIHPGRYSPQTIRVKATTLKTAILILYFEQVADVEIVNANAINQIRKEYLNEPPIKSLSSASGLGRLVDLFQN
jgi:hypothetical protein